MNSQKFFLISPAPVSQEAGRSMEQENPTVCQLCSGDANNGNPKNNVDEAEGENYSEIVRHRSLGLLSAGSPNFLSPQRSTMKNEIEDTLWVMLESGDPDLVPVSDIPALRHWNLSSRSRLCTMGKIPAIKAGGIWLSTSQIVMETLRNRHDYERAYQSVPTTGKRGRGRPRTKV